MNMFDTKIVPAIVALAGLLPSIDRAIEQKPDNFRMQSQIFTAHPSNPEFNKILNTNKEVGESPALQEKLAKLFALADSEKEKLAKLDSKLANNYQAYVERVLLSESTDTSYPLSAAILKDTNNYEATLGILMPYLAKEPVAQSRAWMATIDGSPTDWLEKFKGGDAAGRFKAAPDFIKLCELIGSKQRDGAVGTVIKLYADPTIPDDFFNSTNHKSIEALVAVMREPFHQMRKLLAYEESGHYASKFGSDLVFHYFNKVNVGKVDLETACKQLKLQFDEEHAALSEHSESRLPIILNDGSKQPASIGIQQGDYLICKVTVAKEISTDSLSRCVALALTIKNDKGITTHFGLAHVDPGVAPSELIRIAAEAQKYGYTKFEIIGGSILNSIEIKRCLEKAGGHVDCFDFVPAQSSGTFGRSTNVAIDQKGKIRAFIAEISDEELKSDRQIDDLRARSLPKSMLNKTPVIPLPD